MIYQWIEEHARIVENKNKKDRSYENGVISVEFDDFDYGE